MVWIADDLGAWLIFILAEAGRRKLTSLVFGDEQERALRSAATAAVRRTADDLSPDDPDRAEELGMVISHVFARPESVLPSAGQATMLEMLQIQIATQLQVLDDASLTGYETSPAQALGVPGTVIAAKLTSLLLQEIVSRGARGGPLEPFANQLNHDVTHLQGRQIETMLDQLTSEVREALASLGALAAQPDTVSPPAVAVRNSEKLPYVHDLSPLAVGVHQAVVWAAGDPLHGLASNIGTSHALETATYVRRRHDAEFRQQLADAAARGSGLVWLVGRSCSGKTRSAWEAVAHSYQDWVFADCRNPPVLARLLDNEKVADGNLIVWLDDIHLMKMAASLAMPLQMLFERRGHAKTLAIVTSWPFRDEAKEESEDDDGRDFTSDLARLSSLQKIAAAVVHVREDWFPDELKRARGAAIKDPLLKTALRDDAFSPPQVLAGARWSFGLWETPQYRETSALLTAAIDLSRLLADYSADSPILSKSLLKKCAPCYLNRPVASSSWFKRGLREATTPCHDAVWALIPVGNQYRLFRPLLDYGGQLRAWDLIPEEVWEALASAPLDRVTLGSLRNRARNRMLYRLEERFRLAQMTAPEPPLQPAPQLVHTAIPVLPKNNSGRSPKPPASINLDTSDRVLADRLLKEGDIDGLRALALPSRDGYVRRRLAIYYVGRKDLSNLRDLAAISNKACRELAELLARDGDVNELLRQTVCGNGSARRALESWPIEGLQDSQRSLILQNGLNADGSVARWP